MTWITFDEDVTLESDPDTGPHYKKGSQHDVSEKNAQEWIRSGKATRGKIDHAPQSAKVVADKEKTPTFRTPKQTTRKRRD